MFTVNVRNNYLRISGKMDLDSTIEDKALINNN
jgi:hypothetical protein